MAGGGGEEGKEGKQVAWGKLLSISDPLFGSIKWEMMLIIPNPPVSWEQ